MSTGWTVCKALTSWTSMAQQEGKVLFIVAVDADHEKAFKTYAMDSDDVYDYERIPQDADISVKERP